MRLAVITIMRSESGHTIVGNNVFNLRPGADIASISTGSRAMAGNGSFAVFATPADGARAAAIRLTGNPNAHAYKYDAVVAAAKKGSAVAFLNAWAASAWNSSHYGATGGKPNKLIARYAQAASPGIDTLVHPTGGGPKINVSNPTITGINAGGGNLGAWASQVNFPIGHVLTAADVQSIMSTLVANGWFANDPTGAAQQQTQLVLIGEIGKPWNKTLEQDIQSKLMTAATNANPAAGALGILGDVTQVVSALFDPAKWIRILALIAGAALTAWGGANVLRAAQ